MKLLMTLLVVVASSGCIVVEVGGEADEEQELLFGPDEHCPRECVNPLDETCYHLPGGCGRGDGVVDADEEAEADDGCDPCRR